MKRMHALFAILALSLVALIARPASAYAPKNGFNTLRTESDGSPIVQIGENCKLDAVIKGYGPMYKQATGGELTFRVIRAANPTHTIPVCLVRGDGAMKISRASEKVWENCPADQQSIYLIAGLNDAIRIPMTKGDETAAAPEAAPAPQTQEGPELAQIRKDAACFNDDPCLLDAAKRRNILPAALPAPEVKAKQPAQESPEQIKVWTDAACFTDDTCLMNEAKRRNLLPKAQPAPTPERLLRAEKASVPAPAVSPSVTPAGEKSDAPFWGAFAAFVVAGICAIAFFFSWRSAVSAKARAVQLMQESAQMRLQENKQELETAQAEAKEAWKQWDTVKGELRTANETLKTLESEKPAQDALRTTMLRIAREDCRLGDVPENATIRDLFWRIKNYYVEQVQDLGLQKVFSVPDDLRTMLMNIATNKRHLSIPPNAQPKDILIQIDRSYESELREQRKQLTDEQDKVRDLGTKIADMKGKLDTLTEKHRQVTSDLQEARALTDAAIQDRDAAQRSERGLKAAVSEYAMVLQALTIYERRQIENRKKTEESSDLLVALERQKIEYTASQDEELIASTNRGIDEVNDRLSRLLNEKEEIQERASEKRRECDAIEQKLGFSFSNESISQEVGEYRAEALHDMAVASAKRETVELQETQVQRDLEAARTRLGELEALKLDLEGRLAEKERQLAMREGAVQGLFKEVLTFCDMDPEADVERIYAAGGPSFLMDQMRIRMTRDLTEENEQIKRDLEVANRLVEERNAEILRLCKEIEGSAAPASGGEGQRPKEPNDSSVEIKIPTPEDLYRHGLSGDPEKALDFVLALFAAMPEGTKFHVNTTDDLIRLNHLVQIPVQLPKDPTVLYEPSMKDDFMVRQAIHRIGDLFRDFRVHAVARFLDINGQYLKGMKVDRKLTIMGIPAQPSQAPTQLPRSTTRT